MADLKFSYDGLNTGSAGGLDGLSSTGDATEHCKACEDPYIIPIYPVRIAWNDLYGEVNGGLRYPKTLDPFPAVGGAVNSGGFTLRTARAGNVYVYDETNKVWSIFKVKPDTGKFGARFDRYEFIPAQDRWVATELNLILPYVRDDAETIHIAYSGHAWSSATFGKMQSNTDSLRDKAMTKVVPTAPSSASFSAPLGQIGTLVEEFSTHGISQTREDWDTLSDLSLPACDAAALMDTTSVKLAKGAPLLIALHDPVGVIREIATSHLNRTSLRTSYLEANIYPLTSARAVQTLQQAAADGLKSRGLDSKTRRMFQEWQEAADPAYRTFLDEAEEELRDYDDALDGVLDAWGTFFDFGKDAPGSEPGSLSTHIMLFDADSPTADELEGLVAAAHGSVVALSASKAGLARMRATAFDAKSWTADKNIVAAAIKVTGTALTAASNQIAVSQGLKDVSATLMKDIAMPLSHEIVTLNRVDRLTEVNRFANGIRNTTISRVVVPIQDAVAEVTTGRRRTQQRNYMVQKGHMLHQIQLDVGIYKYEGRVHVSGVPGKSMISKVSDGFAVFANTLSILDMLKQSERDTQRGRYAKDPRLALVLTAMETLTQTVAAGRSLTAPGTATRSYFVHGKLKRAQVAKLLPGKAGSDKFLRTVVREGQITSGGRVAVAAESRALSIIGRIGTGVGIALAVLDLFDAVDAYRRGDRAAVVSNVALGLGAVVMTVGAILSWGGPAIVVGVVLIIIGVILSFFVDDPVERWLKNCFWGKSNAYLYWNDRSRTAIGAYGRQLDPGALSLTDAQAAVAHLAPKGEYDIAKFFAREMQEFHEFVYWPKDVRDPDQAKPLFQDGENFDWSGLRRGEFRWNPNLVSIGERETDGGLSSFRLPNLIDGLSEFDCQIWVLVTWQRVQPHPRYENVGFQEVEVTDEFRNSLRVQGEIVTGSWTVHKDQLGGAMFRAGSRQIKWHVTKVGIVRGWSYTPTPEIQLPQQYHEHWFGGGYDKGEVGGKKVILI